MRGKEVLRHARVGLVTCCNPGPRAGSSDAAVPAMCGQPDRNHQWTVAVDRTTAQLLGDVHDGPAGMEKKTAPAANAMRMRHDMFRNVPAWVASLFASVAP